MAPFSLDTLISRFDAEFLPDTNTRLRGGFPEPLYLPATKESPAEIQFTRDFIRSALHEIAHWCVAGKARRNLVDYGYSYRPDGRTPEEQEQFYKLEVTPQAIEMEFALRAGIPFQVSCDNLNGEITQNTDFEIQVAKRRLELRDAGFSARVMRVLRILT